MEILKYLFRLPIWTVVAYFSYLFITQIEGPTSAQVGETLEYNITGLRTCNSCTWVVDGGIVQSATPRKATIRWTRAGRGTIKFSNASLTVEVAPCNPPVLAGVTFAYQQACGSTTITFANSSGVQLYWQTSAAGESTANAEAAYTVTQSGIYYVRARSSCGAWSDAVATEDVQVKTNPPQSEITPASSICSGTEAQFTANNSAGASHVVTVEASTVSGASGGTFSNNTPVNQTLTNSSPSPANVVYTIIPTLNDCTGPASTYTVTVNPTPSVSAAGTSSIFSNTATDITLTSNVENTTFNWSVASYENGASNGSGNAITQTLSNTSGSAIEVIYQITPTVNNCGGSSTTFSVAVYPIPTVTSNITATSATFSCNAIYTSYSWDRNGQQVSNTHSHTTTTAGDFVLTVSLVGGRTHTATYSFVPAPNAPIEIAGCSYMAAVTVTNSPPANVTWYWQETAEATVTAHPSTTTFNPAEAKTYYLRGLMGTTWSLPQAHTISPRPVVTPPEEPAVSGNTCGSATLTFGTASRGENTWYWQTTAEGTSTAEGMDTKTVTAAGPSTLYVRAKDSRGCWSTAVSKTVTVHPIPPNPTPASGGICTGETFTREAGTGDFSRARWYADAALTNLQFTGQSFSTTPTASPVTYYVINYSEQGCFSDTASFTITTHTKPVVPAAPSCNYDTRALTFNGEPATGIQWCWQTEETGTSTENSSTPYTAPANGVYYLRASNQGCWGGATPIVAWQKSGLQTSKDKDYVKVETILKSGVKTDAEIDALSYTEKATDITYLGAGGHTLESLSLNESPGANDVVNTAYYDKWGRNERSYLPFADGSGNALYRTDADTKREAFYGHATDKIADDTKPYSRVEFENPVTNQVIKSYGAGSDFVDSKYAAANWEFNAANIIRRWTMANNLPTSTDFYPAGDLVVKENRDQGSTAGRTYTDWKGRTVMKEAQVSDTEWAQTFYLYDDYGNVLFVIPPMLAANLTPTQAEVNQWCYQYTYDNRQRKITSKQPGAEWVYTIYDQWDRPVLSQDGIQRSKSSAEWSFIKYDHWNRTVMTGTLTSTATADSLRKGAMSATARYESRTNTSLGYTTTTYPTVTESDVLLASYFDDYGFLSYTNWDAESNTYSFVSETGYEASCRDGSTKKVLDLPTGSKTRVIGMDKWLNVVTYYDDRMRPLQTISENFSGKTDRLTTLYDWPGKVLQTKLVHTYNTTTTTIVERTSYDHRGRILNTYHKINDQDEVTLATFEYNELGQVTKKTLHGGLQAIDYRYNIRGQLTDYNFTAFDQGQKDDFFGQNFEYNDDGTIKTIKWKDDLSGEEKKYEVNYLKRSYTGASYSQAQAMNAYNEDNITYDKNGNIKTLNRSALINNSALRVDQLSYSYTGNQLESVTDAATTDSFNDGNTSGADYSYDVDGNLVEDKNKNIRITYNILGLPQRITFPDNGYFDFTYSASGEKLREAFYNASNTLLAVRDLAGEFIYYGTATNNLTLGLIFHDQGRLVPAANNTWEYQYYLTDHLGSVRSVLQTKPETTTIKATFESDKYAEESDQFSNLKSENEVVHPSILDKKVYKLNANTKVGPYRSFRVLPGDTIRAHVMAYYGAGTWGEKESAANVASAVANALTGGTEYTTGINSGYNNTGTLFGLSPTQSSSKPAAFLNYILFNEQYQPLEAKSQPLGSADIWSNVALPDIKIKKMGYLLVYLSYDNTSGPDVFFNDFTIEYKESNLIQTTAYYPYGMTAYTWMRDAEILNRYGFQGKEWESKTQWYDFHARQYDPVLGRWFALDPANQFASGYMGMGNNPLIGVDPDGKIVFTILTGVVDFVTTALFKGGLDPTSSSARNAAWRNYDPTSESSMTNKAWKIDKGLLQTDPNKSFWGRAWELISRFTWQLPQTALGYAGSGTHNLFGGVKSVTYYAGATAVESYMEAGGIALGNYINGGRGLQADPTNSLFQHEYGHYLQSQLFGLYYLSKVGLPSLSSKSPHNGHPVEQDANIRAFKYFSKHVNGFNWIDAGGERNSRWWRDSNPINEYNWNLSIDDPQNQGALKKGRVRLEWFDYLLGPSTLNGIVNIFVLNSRY